MLIYCCSSHQSQNRLSDLVAEHLDHLHYLNDILLLKITDLNQVLSDHLLHKLLIPLYIYSLSSLRRQSEVTMETATQNLARVLNKSLAIPENNLHQSESPNGKVSCVVALFLLSQVFLIISHLPLIRNLAWIILKTEKIIFEQGLDKLLAEYELYIKSLEASTVQTNLQIEIESNASSSGSRENLLEEPRNITDEEKEKLASTPIESSNISDKPFLETVYNSLDCLENDYAALFALCLLYALANNKGNYLRICLIRLNKFGCCRCNVRIDGFSAKT